MRKKNRFFWPWNQKLIKYAREDWDIGRWVDSTPTSLYLNEAWILFEMKQSRRVRSVQQKSQHSLDGHRDNKYSYISTSIFGWLFEL